MRRSFRTIGAVTAGIAVPVLGLAGLAGPAGASSSPEGQYNAALKASGRQNVHYVSKAAEQGVTITVTGDTGSTSGSQVLSLKKGTLVENVTVTLVNKTGYVKGNPSALINILGLTAKDAAKYNDKWLSFPTSNSTLAELVAGLHDKDVATELKMSGPYTSGGTKTVDGQSAVAIKGFVNTSASSKVPVVLYIQTGSTPRPIEEVTNPGKSGSAIRGSVTFSKWGEKTDPATPSHATSLLSLTPASTSTSTTAG